MFITHEPGVTGRGRNTGWWAGIANLFWWCDREKGVAGMIASQIMPEELVRVIVNDRVQDLKQCGGDRLGRCKLSAFVKSLGFARSGGLWDQCYV